jgi:hypothetical protein
MKIESCRFGEIVIDGKRHTKDLKIVAGEVHPDWWRGQGHLLRLDDLSDVLSVRPHTLIVGTGISGPMRLEVGLVETLGERGIRVAALPTQLAVKRFNDLSAELGPDAAAAFHLTY